MESKTIEWDKLPSVMTLNQFRIVCHVSKTTARFLLKSGKVPCIYTGKKTRCYKIRKKDVITYFEDRAIFPEYYVPSSGWYARNSKKRIPNFDIPAIREDMHGYYNELLQNYPDVLSNEMINEITGYSKAAINGWCHRGCLQHFLIKNKNMIPKVYLVDFFCSKPFRMIARKSDWHKKVLTQFQKWYANQLD